MIMAVMAVAVTAQNTDGGAHIGKRGTILDLADPVDQYAGRENRERGVFGALHPHAAAQRMAALHDDFFHQAPTFSGFCLILCRKRE